ncbi:unnamed protein product [Effrenium voratum]|nr:unnamed protein product [Effrenium voratum]
MAMPDEEELAVPAPIFSVTCANDKEKLGLPDAHDPVTGQGRWLYEGRLGEGGLATVFRAWDCKGHLGKVAVKVLKKHSKAHARHAFAMHRESQWSLTLLHNSKDPRYSAPHAQLFARYLEDHTGFSELGPEDFNQRRRFFEHPDFDWYKQRVDLPARPYVVMELVKGETLQIAMPAMSVSEKREVVLQCATALEYLTRFQLIHRDFRGCNMHLLARENGTAKCQLKILDLGVMISSEVGMEENRNMAVQAFRRRGDTEEKRKRYDWLPWEVRDACDDVQGPVRNFQQPGRICLGFSALRCSGRQGGRLLQVTASISSLWEHEKQRRRKSISSKKVRRSAAPVHHWLRHAIESEKCVCVCARGGDLQNDVIVLLSLPSCLRFVPPVDCLGDSSSPFGGQDKGSTSLK